ncbi:MAG: LacI family DNA-binding transcriptional regulator [Lachnospiraceae bacterium]|nr:LacI family DNA-binding transcriptional regulator [Lachnospiraceae bacterium]
MVTIKDVAKKCNVSIATVSNILSGKPNASEETRKRVLEAVQELNYIPNYVAKNLKMKSTKTIGVIVEDITVFCAPDIIDGITQYCEKRRQQNEVFY